MQKKISVAAITALLGLGVIQLSACGNKDVQCETALQDSFSTWELQLRQREVALREKELNIMERENAIPGYQTGEGNVIVATKENGVNRNGRNRINQKDDARSVAYKRSTSGVAGQYPESSERQLTERDVSLQTAFGLRVMKNEIYARHGFVFSEPDMKRHFSEESWYKGKEKKMGKIKLSAVEKSNIAFIEQAEAALQVK